MADRFAVEASKKAKKSFSTRQGRAMRR